MQCAFRATSEARVRICAWKNVFEYPFFADRSRTMFLVLFDFRMLISSQRATILLLGDLCFCVGSVMSLDGLFTSDLSPLSDFPHRLIMEMLSER